MPALFIFLIKKINFSSFQCKDANVLYISKDGLQVVLENMPYNIVIWNDFTLIIKGDKLIHGLSFTGGTMCVINMDHLCTQNETPVKSSPQGERNSQSVTPIQPQLNSQYLGYT